MDEGAEQARCTKRLDNTAVLVRASLARRRRAGSVGAAECIMLFVAHVSNSGASTKNRRRTLTLVIFLTAISVALVILVIPRVDYSSVPPAVREVETLARMARLETALDRFEIDNGFYPTGTNGLMALVQRPTGTTHWRGPYIEPLPKDPWGRDFHYECPGKDASADRPYGLWSLGGPPGNRPLAMP
jgi:general secretion pathway protein G